MSNWRFTLLTTLKEELCSNYEKNLSKQLHEICKENEELTGLPEQKDVNYYLRIGTRLVRSCGDTVSYIPSYATRVDIHPKLEEKFRGYLSAVDVVERDNKSIQGYVRVILNNVIEPFNILNFFSELLHPLIERNVLQHRRPVPVSIGKELTKDEVDKLLNHVSSIFPTALDLINERVLLNIILK